MFGSRKKTFSGVGSAVQNLLNGEVEKLLTTVAVSATINGDDLGDSFKNNLETGAGIKLRNFIDYTYNKGYTNLLKWETSGLKGEAFSNSNEYSTYLSNIVFPSSFAEVSTEPEIIAKSTEQISSYVSGEHVIKTVRYTVTKKVIKTTDSTISNLRVDSYYQGSNTGYLAINNLFKTEYPELAKLIDPSAVNLYTDTFVECLNDSLVTGTKSVTIIVLDNKASKDVEVTKTGTVLLALNTAINTEDLATVKKTTNDKGEEVITEVPLTGSDVFKQEVTSLAKIKQDVINDPITELNLNTDEATIQTVNIGLFVQAYCNRTYEEQKPETDESTGSNQETEQEEPKLLNAESHGVWIFGKAIIITNKVTDSSNKVLIASTFVETIRTKTITNTQTEYLIEERYSDGKLISSTEDEGASSSTSSSEELLHKTETYEDNYLIGSGNVYLDTILNNTKTLYERFCPFLPVMANEEFCSKNWGDFYKLERKAYKKITDKPLSQWDDFVESFKSSASSGSGVKMIYYWPSVPINVDEDYSNEYLFHFFKWLAVNFGGTGLTGTQIHLMMRAEDNSVKTDFHVQYKFQVYYSLLTGECPVDCKIHHYKRSIKLSSTEPDDSTSYQWKGKLTDFNYNNFIPMTSYDTIPSQSFDMSRENYPDLTDEEYDELVKQNKFTLGQGSGNSTQLTFYYKITENLYEKVLVNNFIFWHLVKGAPLVYYLKSSLQRKWTEEIQESLANEKNAGFAPIIIPIARGALESMGWYRQTGLLQVCHNVLIAGYEQKTIKLKWYQTGIFLIVLIIIVIIITIITWGAGSSSASAVGAAASAGAAGTAAVAGGAALAATLSAIAIAVGKAILVALIAKLISAAANKFIGGALGQIIGTVAAIVATVYLSYTTGMIGTGSSGFWEAMNTWQGYSTLTKSIIEQGSQLSSYFQQNKLNRLQGDYANQIKEQEQKNNDLTQKMYELTSLENNNITDIIVNSTYTTSSTTTNSTSQFIAEDPDTFFYRVFDLDFYDLNKSYISDFEDYQNNIELPC